MIIINKDEGFSIGWEEAYKSGNHRSVWPWSDLVTLFNRFARLSKFDKDRPRLLELGYGAGANIPFLMDLVEYHGIDGSATAVNLCRQRFPELESNLVFGDFSKSFGFKKKFDIILDRASLTHNTRKSIDKIITLIENSLTEDGKYIGVTLFSTMHPQFEKGQPCKDDPFTRSDYLSGPFKSIGYVHFFDQSHIKEVFSNFSIEHLEHIVKTTVLGEDDYGTAYWNLVASIHKR